MINAPTNAVSAEVTPIDTSARVPLLLLVGSGLVWLVVSGILALITSIQLHSPNFLTDFSWLTHGRAQAMRETSFVYGWAANAGLAIALWVLGRLGGNPLRALNWTIVGTLFWNFGVAAGLVGIGAGYMTSFSMLQLPGAIQPVMLFSYATIAISGVLAWGGRRTDGTFAAQWYAAAALFVFPWLFTAAQAVLIWSPVRGVAQAVAAGWFTQGAWTLWLAPLALSGAYYIIPKTAGRVIPGYEFAPLAFWVLIFVGGWTGGRHLIGGPVPAWVATLAVVAGGLLIFHYMVVLLNLRLVTHSAGTAAKYLRFGVIAYMLVGILELITSFRGAMTALQFTFFSSALEQLGLYGAVSMMFFGAIYYMVPRITGMAWASGALAAGHRVLVTLGIVLLVVSLGAAGWTQGRDLLNPQTGFGQILDHLRLPLLGVTAANLILLGANLLLLVNFCKTACSCCSRDVNTVQIFRQPTTLEASAT
jgi:cytochrome c oxidase cbb3-type subunit 1